MPVGFEDCPYCAGFGIVAILLERTRVASHPDEPWLWTVCRCCYGRGCDPSSTMDDWLPIMPEFTRWHYAVDEFELIHFAAQVRYQAPAHPKDILVDKEVQAYRMQTRLNEISLQRKQILKYRIRKMLANQIAELAELTEQIENAN